MDETTAITQLKAGDISGLKPLVEAHQVEAVWAAYLIVGEKPAAEDVVQGAFLRAFANIRSFDDTRPFRPWFFRIVVNDAIKSVQRMRGQVSLDEEEEALFSILSNQLDVNAREPEDAVLSREMTEEISQALRRLSPSQRGAVVMHYFLGMKTSEVASRMDIAPGTLRWHLSSARKRLFQLLNSIK